MDLVWTAPAESDLYEIADYYSSLHPDLPLEILQRVYEAPLILLERPHLGAPTRKPDVRKWSIKRTPFILLYAVRSQCVEIRRVVHNRSNWEALTP